MEETDGDREALDRALVKARDGDPEAFGVVVEAHQARLRSFLAGYVPRADWVDEIAQQAFVSAYLSLKRFQPGTDFYAWLRRIAYNHLRAELERSRRRRRLEKDRLAELAGAELGRRLDREAGGEEERIEVLRDCLRGLPERAREILRSYYAEARPLAEIAAGLGRTADSLKVTLFRIRARLKECIEGKRAAAGTEAP